MTSKQKTPKPSPRHRQSSLETFMNQSECITIQDNSQETPSSPISNKSPYLFITPISNRSLARGENSKDLTAQSTGKAEELSVSLDALAIARQTDNKELNESSEIETISPNTTPVASESKSPISVIETKSPISVIETKSPTSAKETKSPTSAKETKSPTSAKETKSPTSAKETKSPTSAKETKSPISAKEMKSPNSPIEDKSKSAIKKRAKKPRSKTEMDLEWEKLREEKREMSIKNKEIERKMAELNREKDKLKRQIERNEEREREKEIKSQERDTKLKRKEEMLDLKNKEREIKLRLKEVQLQEKENDRNRIEEEKNRRKDKVQAEQERFKNFFVSKPIPSKQQNTISSIDSRFVPFQVKDNMELACLPSKQIDYEEFDAYLSMETQEFDSNTLLAEMKYRRHHNINKQNQPMELQTQNENDIVIVTEGGGDKLCRSAQPLTVRFKLLQFVENQRPAYFGTFFKRSTLVTGRRPFGIDSTIMDYEVDSDLEWEPDDPDAESIKSNDSDEDVSGSQNDSDSEDGFFVPHGYLSEDEGHASDENDEDYPEKELLDPHASYEEKRKQKLQAKQEAWLSEISKKCQLLKPFIISRLSTFQLSYESLSKINKCTAVLLVDDPLQTTPPSVTPTAIPCRPKGVPDMINSTALPYFTQYIHEENIGVDRAVMQFCIFWNEHYLPTKYAETKPDYLTYLKVNKSRLTKTMHKIAKKIENKQWIVSEEFSCTNVLDVNVKNEIKKLFPAKTLKIVEEPDKAVCSSPIIENNNTAKTADKNDITKFVTPLGKLQFTNQPRLIPPPQKTQNFYKTQNDVKLDPKSIASIKRKSLSEMKAVVRIIPEIPISPPDVEMSEMKRVKLSTSNTSIESDIIVLDSPPKEKGRQARRLALGVKGTDSKGTCIHVWK